MALGEAGCRPGTGGRQLEEGAERVGRGRGAKSDDLGGKVTGSIPLKLKLEAKVVLTILGQV